MRSGITRPEVGYRLGKGTHVHNEAAAPGACFVGTIRLRAGAASGMGRMVSMSGLI